MTLLLLQVTRTPQERLSRATILLQVQNKRTCTSKVPIEIAGPSHEGCKFREEARGQTNETCKEEWKRSPDQPQFSHKNNRCLHCAGNHQSHDCPMRQQHQATTASNPASGPGIY